jgi:hypothetical protein
MAKKTLCMFCGKDASAGPMNREHFVPKCFWSKGHRAQKMRPVPAHIVCNEKWSDDNEYLRDILVSEAGAESHPQVRLLRNNELRRKRENYPGAMAKLYAKVKLVPQITASGIYTGDAPAFDVDWPRMHGVLQNIVRGIHYVTAPVPLPVDCVIAVRPATPELMKRFQSTLEQMVDPQGFGDDVFACRYVNTFEPPTIRCIFQFYGRRIFIGEALPPAVLKLHELRQRTGRVLFTGENVVVR